MYCYIKLPKDTEAQKLGFNWPLLLTRALCSWILLASNRHHEDTLAGLVPNLDSKTWSKNLLNMNWTYLDQFFFWFLQFGALSNHHPPLDHSPCRPVSSIRRIYAELTGYGANSDGYDVVAPSGVGGEKCHWVMTRKPGVHLVFSIMNTWCWGIFQRCFPQKIGVNFLKKSGYHPQWSSSYLLRHFPWNKHWSKQAWLGYWGSPMT